MADTKFNVSITGMSKLQKLPDGLEKAQRELLDKASERVAEEIGTHAPGGRRGRVGRSWKGRTISDTKAVISSGHPGARALSTGAFIKAKSGKAIRFNLGGETIYRKFVRLPKTGYIEKGMKKRNKIVRETYKEVFDQIEE